MKVEIESNAIRLMVEEVEGSWCVESPDWPSLFAGGNDRETAVGNARAAVRNEFGAASSILIADSTRRGNRG